MRNTISKESIQKPKISIDQIGGHDILSIKDLSELKKNEYIIKMIPHLPMYISEIQIYNQLKNLMLTDILLFNKIIKILGAGNIEFPNKGTNFLIKIGKLYELNFSPTENFYIFRDAQILSN